MHILEDEYVQTPEGVCNTPLPFVVQLSLLRRQLNNTTHAVGALAAPRLGGASAPPTITIFTNCNA
jgi:hypothetical protein